MKFATWAYMVQKKRRNRLYGKWLIGEIHTQSLALSVSMIVWAAYLAAFTRVLLRLKVLPTGKLMLPLSSITTTMFFFFGLAVLTYQFLQKSNSIVVSYYAMAGEWVPGHVTSSNYDCNAYRFRLIISNHYTDCSYVLFRTIRYYDQL